MTGRRHCIPFMKTPQLPVPKLAAALGATAELWFKREDLHHYGSHKGRSIPLMIGDYARQGLTDFVISSSGNAALAAIQAVLTHNKTRGKTPLSLTVLVGKKIAPDKLALLRGGAEPASDGIRIEQCANPKQRAFQMEKTGMAKWLRQSTDDNALLGYEELASELGKIPNLAAVFIPTSSGATAQGLYRGFQKMGINPEIHLVQTPDCHPLVDSVTGRHAPADSKNAQSAGRSDINAQPHTAEKSLAEAIVDKIAHRRESVAAAVKNSAGYGWIADNQNIKESVALVKKTTTLDISPNSALSVAGLRLAIKAGWRWNGPIVCLITGR